MPRTAQQNSGERHRTPTHTCSKSHAHNGRNATIERQGKQIHKVKTLPVANDVNNSCSDPS
eukprot:768401-Hanusia_phi.AAC.2